MASKIIVQMFDDLDGSEATHTAVFAWDGRQFEVDLNQANYDEMAAFMARYTSVGRMVGRTQLRERKQGRSTTVRELPTRDIEAPASDGVAVVAGLPRARRDREQIKAIREWATNNGYKVSDRGRIPMPVEEAYDKAHTEVAMAGA